MNTRTFSLLLVEVLRAIISVKSGNIGRNEMGELRGTIEREGAAAAGVMITRHKPTAPMKQEAKEAGTFKPEMFQFLRFALLFAEKLCFPSSGKKRRGFAAVRSIDSR